MMMMGIIIMIETVARSSSDLFGAGVLWAVAETWANEVRGGGASRRGCVGGSVRGEEGR